MQPEQPNYYQPPAQQQYYQQQYYQQPQQPYYPQPTQPVAPAPAPLDMGWYKFLIYFALFAGALLNFCSGIAAITGLHYLGDADTVYSMFPDLQLADIINGLGCVGAAILGIVTRFALSGYKASGPKLLTALYAFTLGLGVLYLIMANAAMDGAADLSSSYSSLAASAAMMCINIGYFKKREHLFVN